MKHLAQYPVTFPYGATSPPYSPSRPHLGNDRAAPKGTPIIIGDTLIGTVGSTGLSTGFHTHTQAGTDIACQNTIEPSELEFKPGVVVALRTTDQNQWGRFVTVKVGTKYITYAHLDTVNVNIGHVIKEQAVTKVTTELNRIVHTELEGWPLHETHSGKFDAQLMASWNGKDLEQMIWSKWNKNGKWREQRDKAMKAYPSLTKSVEQLTQTVADKDAIITAKDKEIASLKAQVGDNSKWETLKALIRELIGVK